MKFNLYAPTVRRTSYGYVEQRGNALYVISDNVVELGLAVATLANPLGTADWWEYMPAQREMALKFASGYSGNNRLFREYISEHGWKYSWVHLDWVLGDGKTLYAVSFRPNSGSVIGAQDSDEDWSSWLEAWLNAWMLWCNN